MSAKAGAVLAAALVLAAAISGCVGDRIDFGERTSGIGLLRIKGEAGVLIDGRRATPGQVENDAGFIANSQVDQLPIPNFVAGGRNELFAFTQGRRPVQLTPSWSEGTDIIGVEFPQHTVLPIRVWIVSGNFQTQADHAREAILRTQVIWRAERMGVSIGEVEFVDATKVANVNQVTQFPNGDMGDAIGWQPLRSIVGFRPGRLNIYWVDTVNGSQFSGWSNFDSMIVMGAKTGDELLVHEIGHAFGLRHVDDTNLPVSLRVNFDDTNIMDSFSNTRRFITEGQIVRAWLDQNSVLRSLYPTPSPELPLRNCPSQLASASCPALDRRLWADGIFPANN